MSKKVSPLKSRIHTLNQLQLEALDICRKVRFQFGRMPHEDGMSDNEFLERILSPFEEKIYQDRAMAEELKNQGL